MTIITPYHLDIYENAKKRGMNRFNALLGQSITTDCINDILRTEADVNKLRDLGYKVCVRTDLIIIDLPFNGSYSEVWRDQYGEHYAHLPFLAEIDIDAVNNSGTRLVVQDYTLPTLMEQYHQSLILPPKEISPRQWRHMLEVLPPCKWGNCGGWEIFHLSERYSGDIVYWYAKRGNECYELRNRETLTHTDIVELLP